MNERRKITTISLPHRALSIVESILAEAGFTLGYIGSGTSGVERFGEISDEEVAELRQKMGEALFVFDTSDIQDEDEENV